jgi:hypothetical protein
VGLLRHQKQTQRPTRTARSRLQREVSAERRNNQPGQCAGFFVLVASTLDCAVIPLLHKHSLFTTVISEILKK